MVIDQNLHLHAGAAAFGESLGKLVGDRAALIKILSISDAFAGAADRLKHCRKYLLPVEQEIHSIASDNRRVGMRGYGRKERRLAKDYGGDLIDVGDARAAGGD